MTIDSKLVARLEKLEKDNLSLKELVKALQARVNKLELKIAGDETHEQANTILQPGESAHEFNENLINALLSA